MRFAGNRAGEKGIAGAGRADEEDAFGDVCANGFIAFGMLEKVDDFLQFVFGFFTASDVVKGDAGFLLGDVASAAFAEAEDGFAGLAHAAADKSPDENHDADGNDPG